MSSSKMERQRSAKPVRPGHRLERALSERIGAGARVAGVDEAGRGPLAGPVVAAAVIWRRGSRMPRGLNDSKQVSAADRMELFVQIAARAESAAVALATAEEIDSINILEATRLAARRALSALVPPPDAVLTDALALPGCPWPVEPVIKGDCKSVAIAAASILAKVVRDRLMDILAEQFPGYGWQSNRGYPTPDHYRALDELGPTTMHRLTFRGVSFFNARLRPSRLFAERETNPVNIKHVEYKKCWRLAPVPEGMASADAFAAQWLAALEAAAFLPEREDAALERLRCDPRHNPDWL